jgi:hypothetical protein
MRRNLVVVAALVAIAVLPAVVSRGAPEVRDARHAKIVELLDLTGIGDLADQIVQGTVAPVKQAMPEVPEEWWDGFAEGVDTQAFLDRVIPIHDKHLTDAELDALLGFYRTPEGQSVLSKLPIIGQESMMVGQMWSMQVGEELVAALEAAGYKVPEDFRP